MKGRLLLGLILIPFICMHMTISVRAETFSTEEIQQFLDSLEQDHCAGIMTFQELMDELMEGNLAGILQKGASCCSDLLFTEIRSNRTLMGQILVLGVMGAVLSGFSGMFGSGHVTETSFYVVYLLTMTFLAAGFFSSVQIAVRITEELYEFMKVLLPAYFLAIAAAGGTMTSAAVCGFTFGAMGIVQGIMAGLLLPLTKVYMLLVLAGNLLKEDMISKCRELLEHVIRWSLRTMFGIVVGFHVIQGMILPQADAVKNASLMRLVQMIPGVGTAAGTVARVIVGSGVLIKNTAGIAGVIMMAFLAAVPLMKLWILMCLYYVTAAVMQPVCDKRLVECMTGAAAGHGILLKIAACSLALFAVTIAVLCVSTNGVWQVIR